MQCNSATVKVNIDVLQGNTTKVQLGRAQSKTGDLPAPWSPYAYAAAEMAALTAVELPNVLESLVPSSLIPEVERLLQVSHLSKPHRSCLTMLCQGFLTHHL